MRGRIYYSVVSERVEVAVGRRLVGNLDVELVGQEVVGRNATRLMLGFRLPF
jgi:hypothetical protein